MNETSFAAWCDANHAHISERPRGEKHTCKEASTALTVQNDGTREALFALLDGGVFPEGDCCDWLIAETPSTDTALGALLELKGKDLEKAIRQLQQSVKRMRADVTSGLLLRNAVVVCRGGPSNASTKWQAKVKAFHKATRCSLSREACGKTIPLSKLLSSHD